MPKMKSDVEFDILVGVSLKCRREFLTLKKRSQQALNRFTSVVDIGLPTPSPTGRRKVREIAAQRCTAILGGGVWLGDGREVAVDVLASA